MKYMTFIVSLALAMMLLVSCGGQPNQAEGDSLESEHSESVAPENERPEVGTSEEELAENEHTESEAPETEQTEGESSETEPVEELSREELIEQILILLDDYLDQQYDITSWGTYTYPDNEDPYVGIGCLTQEDVDALEEDLLERGYDSNLFHVFVFLGEIPV